MKKLSDFTDQQYAEKLGVSIKRIDYLRRYVHRHFYIEINQNPPHTGKKTKTFSARLKIFNANGASLGFLTFCSENGKYEFNSPKRALNVALQRIRHLEFEKNTMRHLGLGNIPPNILLLFDTEYEKRRIMQKAYFLKLLNSNKGEQAL